MLKRTLSFLLCMVMVMSFAAPAMAAESSDIYVSNGNLDDIVVGDNVSFENVTIDNDKVGITTPGGAFGNTVKPIPEPEGSEQQIPDAICKCDECDTLAEHKENCSVKVEYQRIATGAASDVFAQWGEYTYEEQAYMLDYLRREYPILHENLLELLNAPRGSDSETLADGTIVNVDRIPNDGSVTVQDASEKVQAIVDKFVEENAKNSTELFSYDVSVQDGKGADWQPDATVYMELEMPGVKLHKYSQVFVVHVDDDGNATKIPAKVTEDGKIAFETPGFSTFAGFTVDFDYEGAQFSINGLTSILLSELFDELRIPHDAQDVTNVVFSDTSLVTVEQKGSNWLLTSLKAFTSNETLDVTLNDGTAFTIKVTDASYPKVKIGSDGTLRSTNGELNWYADGDGDVSNGWGNYYYSYANFWSQDKTIYVTGEGTLTINIWPAAYASSYKINICQINVDGGAKVRIIMPDGTDSDYGESWSGRELTIQNMDERTMFQVYDGELVIRGSENEQNLIIDGNGSEASKATDNPLIRLNADAKSLVVTDVQFQDGREGAIRCRANEMSKFTVNRCSFASSVKRTGFTDADGKAVSGGNGGAVYIMSNTADSNGAYVQIHEFQMDSCTFSSVKATGYGGAVCILGSVHKGTISNCTFTSCKSNEYQGGALDLSGNFGAFTVSGTTFSKCSANSRGGAVVIRSAEIKNSSNEPRYTRANTFTFSGCTFDTCSAGSHGGGIAVQAQIKSLVVSDCDFKDCDTNVNGGGISIDAKELPDDFKKSNTTTTDADWAAAIDCTTCTDYGSEQTGYKEWGTTNDPNKMTIIGTVSIDTGCTFTNCTAIGTISTDANGKKSISGGNGGGIEFADGCYITESATISGATIDGCVAKGEATAIFWSGCFVKQMYLTDSVIKNCYYMEEDSPGTGGTVKTIGNSCVKMTVSGCDFLNNRSLTNGGGFYWNAAKIVDGQEPSAVVTGCTFDGNYATTYGGGIFVESHITIIGCNIKNNRADKLGGGIAQQVYNNPSARMLDAGGATDLKLDPRTWVHMNSAPNGGGISIRANETGSITDGTPIEYTVRFELNGAAVYKNTATENGGGIYFIAESYSNADKQAEVDKFTKEILINAGEGTNAAVYKNTAGNNGGGIYMESSKNTTLEVTGGYISSNVADSDKNNAGNGGGIYMTGKNATCKVAGGTIGGEGKDSEDTPLANTAICGGGIAIAGGAKIEMDGGTICYNNVGTTKTDNRQGGGIWLESTSSGDVHNTMTMSGGNVIYNTTPGGVSSNGGGIYIGTNNTFEFSDGTIDHNSCNIAWGGGIYIDGGCTVTLSGGTISNNNAGAGAGLLTWSSTGSRSTLTMQTGCIVTNNEVIAGDTGNGGGMYLGYCNAEFKGGEITENIALNNGGGLDVNYATVTIYAADITYNKAKCGGGISVGVAGTSVKVTVDTSGSANDNTATIYKNTATSSGGGIYVVDASATVEAGSITYNQAFDETTNTWGLGGGIYANNGTVEVTATDTSSGMISHNEASNGGGIYAIDGADVTVTNGYLTYNTAHSKPADLTTAFKKLETLKGTGGGVFIARGTSSNSSTFTLNGETYAIYGNLADFAADDVFANGEYTTLSVPKVVNMNLTDYEFNPEAWFEDYPANDSDYNNGLNLAAPGSGITNGKVFRYRGSDPLQRVMINDDVVDTTVNVANDYICMTLGMPAAINDTVVIDFGKPVNINVLQNEIMNIGNATLMGIGELFTHEEGKYGYPAHDSRYTSSYKSSFGEAKVENGNVTFNLNSLAMDKEVSFSYEVKYTNSKENNTAEYFYYYADVTIIPATTIYYEDNCGYGISYTGTWTSTDPNATMTSQDPDRPGSALDTTIDKDNVYGYDSTYANCNTYSMNSAKKATVSKGKPASLSFTFKGTGFDVISLTDSTTGVIVVKVMDKNGNPIENYLVDTYYGYKYANGVWTPSKSGDQLYQVPVIKVDMNQVAIKDENGNPTSNYYGYDEYKVEIVASYGAIFDHNATCNCGIAGCTGCYDFYLDAIRIYNPANNGKDNATIENAYTTDKEGWPTYYEVRNMLIDKGAFNGGVTSVSGAVFIDGSNAPAIADYKNYGPNNEVYLAQNQSIAFKLNLDKLNLPAGVKIASVQIGLRTLGGTGSCSYKIYNPDTTDASAVTATTVSTATDMFYNITDLCYDAATNTTKSVVVNCTSATLGLCITNLKITFTGNPGTTVNNVMPVDLGGSDIADALASLTVKAAEPALTPLYPTLSLENEVRYNVTFKAENLGSLTADRMGLAVFYSENYEGTIENADDVIQGAAQTKEGYKVSTNGIPAKNLGDDLYFKLFIQLEDGSYVYSNLYHYSAAIYARNILNSGSEQQKAVAVALMNYGAEAQKYFNYKTDDLMNKDITAELQAMLNGFSADSLNSVISVESSKQGVFTANGGFTNKYPSVTTGGVFEINYYFAPEFVVDGNMTLYCWSEDTYLNAEVLTAENADAVMTMDAVNGEYVGNSQQIVAKDMDKTVYAAAVYESNGTIYCTGVLPYSIAAYCQSNAQDAELADIANAIAVYGNAAKALFGE